MQMLIPDCDGPGPPAHKSPSHGLLRYFASELRPWLCSLLHATLQNSFIFTKAQVASIIE